MEPDARVEVEEALHHIIPRRPFPQYIDDAVFLDVQDLLGRHPDKLTRAWSEKPRLYTLLGMLGHHDDTPVFQKFATEQINDYWLPLPPTILSHLSSSVGLSPQDWRRAQLHVLSRSESMSAEKLLSPVHSHRFLKYGSSHLEEMEMIGKGGSAEVARVRHKLSGMQFACKRILRADTIKAQRMQLVEFEQEVGVLKRINHDHLVSFVASFSDLTAFALILNPVAKDVLKSLLERQSRDQPLPDADICTLRHAFGCLATALAYLHEQKVRHKDIKPGNILLSEGRVYLCDFGIARDWSKSENSTTEGDVMKFTQRYCAPEVFERDPRNSKSDIWSLGCVYLEMLSVVKGYPLDEVNSFLLKHSIGTSAQGLWCAPEAISAWLTKIRSEKNDSADDTPLDWITQMIRTDAEDRLRASALLDMIHNPPAHLPHPGFFIGPCCRRADSIAPIDAVDSPTLHDRPVGLGVRIASSGRRGDSGDRSLSPHSQSYDIKESTETTSPQLDSLYEGRYDTRHIATPSNSPRTSSQFSPPATGSDISSSRFGRSPVSPPTTFEVKCGCASRPNEKHILNAAYASPISGDIDTSNLPFQIDSEKPTIENCNCEIGMDKIQVYESWPQEPSTNNSSTPRLWCVTRRLVVSHLSGNPKTRQCSSFWLPLADMQFTLTGNAVTLCWSDCNQMTERRSGNYGRHYDWIYDPKHPNNKLTICFKGNSDAQRFIDVIRFPYEDGITVRRGPKVHISDSSEVNIFEVGRLGVRSYRVATLTTVSSLMGTSKLYIHWPQVDIDMRISASRNTHSTTVLEYQMTVEIKNIAIPTYYSDCRNEPAAEFDKVARFSEARQLKANMLVTFPIGVHLGLPIPPNAVIEMLRGLTGWTLRYFAIVTRCKSKNKRFGSKNYGRANVMLWERDIHDSAMRAKRPGSVVTFRLHEEADLLWMSGVITPSTDITYSTGLDATITVSGRARGKLLHVGTMTAIASEKETPPFTQRHSRSSSDAKDDLSDLVLTFEGSRYRLEFLKVIEEFKATAALSDDSLRRINTLAI